jgi:hypothetical protein
MGCGRIWKSVASPDISRIACCDRGYDCPSGRPLVSNPATYCSSTPRVRPPAVTRWHIHLRGLATPIREISGLGRTGARAISDSRRLKRATYNIPQSQILNLHSEIIEAPLLLRPLDTETSGVKGFVSVTNAWWFVNGVFRRVSAN